MSIRADSLPGRVIAALARNRGDLRNNDPANLELRERPEESNA